MLSPLSGKHSLGMLINSLLVCFSLCGLWIGIEYIWMGANSDTGWLVYAARQLYQGKQLYTELAETNPPLIILYNLIAVMLSPDPAYDLNLYQALVLAVIVLSVAASLWIALKSGYLRGKNPFLFTSVLVASLLMIPGNNFVYAQREHLFVIFCLPYLIYSLPGVFKRYSPTNTILLGISSWASLGILLKPHFLILVMVIETAYLLFLRRINLARVVLCATIAFWGVLYVNLTYLLHPSYFTEIIPDLIRTYDAHKLNDGLIFFKFITPLIALALLVPTLLITKNIANRDDIIAALVLVLVGIFLVLMQYKGWVYSYYPMKVGIYLLLYAIVANSRFHSFAGSWAVLTPTLSVAFSFAVFSTIYFILTPPLFQKIKTDYGGWMLIAWLPFVYHIFRETHYAKAAWQIKSVPSLIYFLSQIILVCMLASYCLPQYADWLVVSVIAAITVGVFSGVHNNKPALAYRSTMVYVGSITLLFTIPLNSYIDDPEDRGIEKSRMVKVLARAIKTENPESVYIFNANLYPAFPAVNSANVLWAARYHHLWMFPALYKNRECDANPNLADIEIRVLNNLEADLRKSQPDLLIDDISPQKFLSVATQYGFMRCMQKHPGLNDIFSHYEPIKTINICKEIKLSRNCAYVIYRKKGSY